jgi:hypothetical protein
MTNLRFLLFSTSYDIDRNRLIANLDWFISSLERMRGCNLLEEITIILYPDSFNRGEVIDRLTSWITKLNTLFILGGFPSFRKVLIYLDDFSELVEKFVQEEMSKLQLDTSFIVIPLREDVATISNQIMRRAFRATISSRQA